MESKRHWESIYRTRTPESLSWYAPHLQQSLEYIKKAAPHRSAAIIDVGGGEATLVDDLVALDYANLTVMDLSSTALQVARQRLGAAGERVHWLAADVLETRLGAGAYDIWHDRAVFHFLATDAQRERYVAQVLSSLKPGGFAIVGTFGPQGPTHCSGLPVTRYAPAELHGKFGAPFELVESSTEVHTTPWGAPQQFVYCFCRMRSN
jgi:2-polyprenyl-3-methyl-5-hydroxy-6-metoxy-1,4-benzoquinol methylase